MWTRLASGLVVLVLSIGVGAAVGCSMSDGESDSSDDAVTNAAFNKNHLLDDAVLLDDAALTEQQVQNFLNATPFGTESPLAEYHDASGRGAAKILHDAATAAGVNVIELLVRLQMEYALIGGQGTNEPTDIVLTDDTDGGGDDGSGGDPDAASDDSDSGPTASGAEAKADPMVKEKIAQAFNCGQSAGFEAQATCAAKAIARAMQNLGSGHEASGGWKIGAKTLTVDKVSVTPDNAATAALYSYTPYIGEKGGGAKGVAGVSGHTILWKSFTGALKYRAPSCAAAPADTDGGSASGCGECSVARTSACSAQGKGSACLPSHTCGCTKDSDCGGVSSGRVCNRQSSLCEQGCRGSGNGCPFGQTCSSTDDTGGVCTGVAIDAGAPDDGGSSGDRPDGCSSSSGKDNNDDGAGHQTPSSNSGDGSSHTGSSKGSGSSSSASSDDSEDAGRDAGKGSGGGKKGCSAAGAGGSSDLTLAFALGLLACTRRRRATKSRSAGRR